MKKNFLSISILAAALTACGGDDSESTSNSSENLPTVSGIDASSAYAYYDLDAGQVLTLTDEEASENTEWDIAFYATNVIVNGGFSGPGSVKAYFTGNNSDYRDDQGEPVTEKFVSATPESEYEDYTAVTSVDIPDASEFTTDTFTTVFGSNFYSYNFMDHSISENDAQLYLVAGDDGLYEIRVTDLSNLDHQSAPSRSITAFTLGVKFKGVNDADFSQEQLVVLPECDDQAYFDLSAYSSVAADDEWDLTLLCSDFEIQLGADSTAHAYKDDETWNKALEYAGTEYAGYYFTSDYAETVFKHQHKWYEYDLKHENQIWSQYGVYLIDTGTSTYKFQITSYYGVDSSGNVLGRNYSFRYDNLVSQ